MLNPTLERVFGLDVGCITLPNFPSKAYKFQMRLVNWPADVRAPGMNSKGTNDVKNYSAHELHQLIAPRLTYYQRQFSEPDKDPDPIELKSFVFEPWTEGCIFLFFSLLY